MQAGGTGGKQWNGGGAPPSSGLQLAAAGIRKEPLDTPRQGLALGFAKSLGDQQIQTIGVGLIT
jgi:hypothetical protein